MVAEHSSFDNLTYPTARSGSTPGDLLNSIFVRTMESQLNSDFQKRDSVGMGTGDPLDVLVDNGLHSQDSFGRWIDGILTESAGPVIDPVVETSISSYQGSVVSPGTSHLQSPVPENIFSITDLSPEWAYSNEKTKVLVIYDIKVSFA